MHEMDVGLLVDADPLAPPRERGHAEAVKLLDGARSAALMTVRVPAVRQRRPLRGDQGDLHPPGLHGGFRADVETDSPLQEVVPLHADV